MGLIRDGTDATGGFPDWAPRLLFNLRLPRIALALITGAALSTAGVSFQGVFRNPLADPYLLGVSAGAGLGATIAIVWKPLPSLGIYPLPVLAFIGATLAAFLVYRLATFQGQTGGASLLLSGVAVGSTLTAIMSFLMVATEYDLDATDISKLTAYYVLYSKQPAFVDVAARLLFQQVSLEGASPVSVPAVGYDLIIETSPEASQVISFSLDDEELSTPEVETTTAEPTPIPLYRIGNTIAVRAGPILDHNNHIVPDGTVARFTMSTRVESGGILRQVEAITEGGIARATFVIDKPGSVEISVASEPALVSEVLQFEASNEGGVAVTVVVPVVT